MKYYIQDTTTHTLGEINKYFHNELKKTNLIKNDIVVDETLKVKIAMMEIDRIFAENSMSEFVSFDLGKIQFNHTGNCIEISDNEIQSRFEDAFNCILNGLKGF